MGIRWQVVVTFLFLQAEYAQARQLDGLLRDVDRSSQGETANAALLALETQEAELALVLPCFLEVPAAEEVLIGAVQVSVSEGITPPTAAPEPCLQISLHTAPHPDGHCH